LFVSISLKDCDRYSPTATPWGKGGVQIKGIIVRIDSDGTETVVAVTNESRFVLLK
jgi:hypothetical protein